MGEGHALSWSCDCSKMALGLEARGAKIGSRLICYCNSCRGADLFLRGNESGLTAHQGVEIFQTTPDYFTITQGHDQIAVMQITPNGPLRWYAKCCGAPIANTMKKVTTPFIGIVLPANFQSPKMPELGAPKSVYTRHALPKSGAPKKDEGFVFLVFKVISRMLGGSLRKNSGNIFVNEDGALIAQIHQLSPSERESLYALGGSGMLASQKYSRTKDGLSQLRNS